MTVTISSYRLCSTLGVGTFGKVKLAVHEVTSQKVAVKVINKPKMLAMDMLHKIRREINILKAVTHPHVIRLYELIDTPSDIFVVMEYVPGGELFDHIVQKSRLTEGEARRFFQQIVSGVDYCHRQLVCHRDLKPENILLDTDLNVKICDFGLSNFIRDGDFLNTSCGSPNYASPEVVSGKAYGGAEVDVWSCGVILYALLCGSLPFDDEHIPNLFKRIKHGNFSLPGHLSEQARSLIVRMLVVDPARRITIQEIRRHAWFKSSLPSYLSAPILHNMLLSTIDHSILAEMRKLGYEVTTESVEAKLKQESAGVAAKEAVAYHLLADKKARQCSLIGGCWLPPSAIHCSAIFAQVELGRAAGSHADPLPFVWPRSLHRQASWMESTHLDDSFIGNCPRHLPPTFSGQQRCQHTAFSRSHPPSSVDGNSGSGPAFSWATARWKLGVESTLASPSVVTAILTTLKSVGYRWVLVSPYRIRCSPVPRAANLSDLDEPYRDVWLFNNRLRRPNPCPNIVLTIQLYKVTACRYLIDVQLFDGPVVASLSEGLWITSTIYATLTHVCFSTTKK